MTIEVENSYLSEHENRMLKNNLTRILAVIVCDNLEAGQAHFSLQLGSNDGDLLEMYNQFWACFDKGNEENEFLNQEKWNNEARFFEYLYSHIENVDTFLSDILLKLEGMRNEGEMTSIFQDWFSQFESQDQVAILFYLRNHNILEILKIKNQGGLAIIS